MTECHTRMIKGEHEVTFKTDVERYAEIVSNVGELCCRVEAKTKEFGEKVDYQSDGKWDGTPIWDTAYCPICGKLFHDGDADWLGNYCSNCGKKLIW